MNLVLPPNAMKSSAAILEKADVQSSPMIVHPPKGANWKDFGGKFVNISTGMQRILEEAANRSRND